MMRASSSLVLLAIFAAACTHRPATRQVNLPDTVEISDYVTHLWAPEFNQRFSRFAGRPGQPSDLVSVQNAHCELNWGGSVADCSYEVTARFNGGEPATRRLWSEFERDRDGGLNEVIIMWHERRR
jgi:hypothetical protein